MTDRPSMKYMSFRARKVWGCEISEGERSKRVMHDWRMSVIRWLILQGWTDKGRFEAWSNERLMSELYRQMESLDTDI